jgi:hypothetical protein
MATYTFTFPAAAAGCAVTVRDSAGSTVDTGTVGAASAVQGSATYSATLDPGTYVGEATNAGIHFSSRAPGVFDVEAAVLALPALAVAANVDPASGTFAADLVTALIDAGLMAAPA